MSPFRLLCITVTMLLVIARTTEAAGLFRSLEPENEEDSMIGKIKSGFKMAGKLLGVDAAAGVASLVASAFPPSGSNSGAGAEGGGWASLLGGALRALSLEPARVGAILLNAIVFLATLLTTSIVPKNPALPESPRQLRDGSPIDWILQNPSGPIQSLINIAKDENLPYKIIETLDENSRGTDTSCVQLLICKTAPFIWGMQRAISALKSSILNGTKAEENQIEGNALFRHLPEVDEFLDNGHVCEKKYEECRLLD